MDSADLSQGNYVDLADPKLYYTAPALRSARCPIAKQIYWSVSAYKTKVTFQKPSVPYQTFSLLSEEEIQRVEHAVSMTFHFNNYDKL